MSNDSFHIDWDWKNCKNPARPSCNLQSNGLWMILRVEIQLRRRLRIPTAESILPLYSSIIFVLSTYFALNSFRVTALPSLFGNFIISVPPVRYSREFLRISFPLSFKNHLLNFNKRTFPNLHLRLLPQCPMSASRSTHRDSWNGSSSRISSCSRETQA